jgi:DNA-binding NarL/FixJ family response regulator
MDETPRDLIRLVLLDAQALFRESLSCYLASQPGLEVAGECGTAAGALEVLRGVPVDVVLLDLDLPAAHNEFISAAVGAGYKGRFLALSGSGDTQRLAAAVNLGTSGIFLKSEAPDRLVQAIRLVASGAVWVDRKVIQLLAAQLVERPHTDAQGFGNLLTEREEKVLLGILEGLGNRKIGDKIGLSESTVKTVVQQLFLRSGVRTRSQLVRMALEGSFGNALEWAHGAKTHCGQ